MSLERTANKIAAIVNIPWDQILEMLIDIINDCFSNLQDFSKRQENITILDKVALRLRIRRFLREEGIFRPRIVRRISNLLVDVYQKAEDDEIVEAYGATMAIVNNEDQE